MTKHIHALSLGLASCISLTAPQATWADSQESKNDEAVTEQHTSSILETVVVTGTRTEHALIDAPVKVEVISQQQLQQQHAFDLSEGLKTIPGVQLKPVTGKQGVEAWIQGVSANRVLILIDGEPISPTTGSSIDLTQISTNDIARIEVVKGASSALYGSQAMGGVINVITAKPEQGLHGSIRQDYGSYGKRNTDLKRSKKPNDFSHKAQVGRIRTGADLSFANEAIALQANFNLRDLDGYQINPRTQNIEGPEGHRNNFTLGASFTPDSNSLYKVRLETYEQELTTQTFAGAPINALIFREDNSKRQRASLLGQWDMSHGSLTAQAFTEKYTTESKPDNSSFRETEMPMTQANFQYTNEYFESHTLTMGMQYYKESLSSIKNGTNEILDLNQPSQSEQSRENIEAYIQDEWTLGALTLIGGIRLQNDNDFGNHSSPKINARFDFNPNIYLRAGVGTAYRVPNLKERYYVFDHSNFGYMVLGNSALDPERSLSYQFGLVFTDRQNVTAEINLFRNELDDLIEVIYLGRDENGLEINQYSNINEALTEGIELSAQTNMNFGLKFGGGYTYLKAKNRETGRTLNDRPEHQVKFNINYITPWSTDIGLIYNWQSKAFEESRSGTVRQSDDWQQIDLKLTQDIDLSNRQTFSIYGGIDNLTDEIQDFEAVFDNRPSIGRVVYLGLKYQF